MWEKPCQGFGLVNQSAEIWKPNSFESQIIFQKFQSKLHYCGYYLTAANILEQFWNGKMWQKLLSLFGHRKSVKVDKQENNILVKERGFNRGTILQNSVTTL